MARVLIVEDEAPLRRSMVIALKREGHSIVDVGSCAAALEALDSDIFDLAIFDQRLPDRSGMALLREVNTRQLEMATLMMTAYGRVETAVEAMQLGASDYLEKPFGPERLAASVMRAVAHHRVRAELRRREAQGSRAQLVGESDAIKRVREQIVKSSAARVVLICGETGTGKDIVSRAVHAAYAGADSPYVVVNCGAFPETLIESELFGHVKGAFSGAETVRRGMLAEAEDGTVFLDEVAELPLTLQPRLLRFLESGEVRPVGADRHGYIKCQVVAATHRDLVAEVQAGNFRQDLFYRLDVFRIVIPPLRERPEDIAPLTEHLIERVARRLRRPAPRVSAETLARMSAYGWPGNVRQLHHALERAMLLVDDDELPAELIVPHERRPAADTSVGAVGGAASVEGAVPDEQVPTLAAVERDHILAVLEHAEGDRSRAARLLGIARSTLRRKLNEYGVGRTRD